MNKRLSSGLTLSCLSLLPLGQVDATGFIEDSKATLGFRTFYMNQDDRNSDRPRIDETGQAFLFEYKSGFTEGFVGFGLDVIAQEGVRLDGGGRAGKVGAERAPGAGSMFPLKSNGKSQEDYGRLNATGKMRISKTIAEVGVLRPTLPILKSNDGRLLPQLFHGAQVTSNEFSNLTFVGGRLEHSTERNSTDSQALFIGGAANNQRSNEFYYGGVDYKATKALTLQYYYSNLDDFYEQHFFGLVHNWALPVGALKSDLRYWTSNSDGANGSSSGRAEGYRSSGYWGSGSSHVGEVDNDTLHLYPGRPCAGRRLPEGHRPQRFPLPEHGRRLDAADHRRDQREVRPGRRADLGGLLLLQLRGDRHTGPVDQPAVLQRRRHQCQGARPGRVGTRLPCGLRGSERPSQGGRRQLA